MNTDHIDALIARFTEMLVRNGLRQKVPTESGRHSHQCSLPDCIRFEGYTHVILIYYSRPFDSGQILLTAHLYNSLLSAQGARIRARLVRETFGKSTTSRRLMACGRTFLGGICFVETNVRQSDWYGT